MLKNEWSPVLCMTKAIWSIISVLSEAKIKSQPNIEIKNRLAREEEEATK